MAGASGGRAQSVGIRGRCRKRRRAPRTRRARGESIVGGYCHATALLAVAERFQRALQYTVGGDSPVGYRVGKRPLAGTTFARRSCCQLPDAFAHVVRVERVPLGPESGVERYRRSGRSLKGRAREHEFLELPDAGEGSEV